MKSKVLNAVDHPELPLARKPDYTDVPAELVLRQSTLSGAIALCVQVSGLEEKEVYLSLGIDAGHWTRIMKGDAHFPVNKLGDLMDLCGNEAPLSWLVYARGYDLHSLRKRETETERKLRQAEEEIRKLKEEARIKADFVSEFMGRRVA